MSGKKGLAPEQAKILEDLEKILDKTIPPVENIELRTFGVKIEGENVIGLDLSNTGKSSMEELDLGDLEALGLSDGDLSALQESMSELKSLQTDLSNNQISALLESISKLKSLQKLALEGHNILTIPESIGNLTSLKELDLTHNKLSTLPESISKLEALQILSLGQNDISTFPVSITKLKSLQKLELNDNRLSNLPEAIGNLSLLQTLNLKSNNISTIPKSIGNLASLTNLDFSSNNLTNLPDSITKLESLQSFSFTFNKLTTLPESFWRLKNLVYNDSMGNPWEDSWKEIEKYTVQTLLERSRQIAPIVVFISHLKSDKKNYHVKKLKKVLKAREEIREVYSSGESDILKSHLVLFIATKNSISAEQCQKELELAKNNNIGIIPIKGTDISFEDLNQIDLGEDYSIKDKLGLEFDVKKFTQFCDELYQHIKKYKREFNIIEPDLNTLYERKQRKGSIQWENIKNIFAEFVESEEFQANIEENHEHFKKIISELRSNQITPVEYIIKWSQILKHKLNSL